MFEAPYIIRANIRHYQELLREDKLSSEQRSTVLRLLASAQETLPLAEAADRTKS